MSKTIKSEYENIQFDRVVAVPMDVMQLRRKGFNHAELLAKSIAKRLNVPYSKNCLIKASNIERQSLSKSARDRRTKVLGIYTFNDIYNLKGETILLVDDITTTGSTIDECSKILKKFGSADKVYGATFAVTVSKKNIEPEGSALAVN